MPRYVALLGSINVGGNRLKMAELAAALERHGFVNVDTVVASGNVLFDHEGAADATLGEAMGRIVKEEFGFDTFAAVRTKAELQSALDESPFAGVGEDRFVHVHFLTDQPDTSQFAKLGADHDGRGLEKIAPGTRALHIDYVSSVAANKLTVPYIERRLGCKGTARNIRSLKRIIEKFD